jgi:hypothetical protein
MADELRWRPRWVTDPIFMEYVLREVEIEAELKNRLIEIELGTLANIHSAIAEGARAAQEAIGGKAGQG